MYIFKNLSKEDLKKNLPTEKDIPLIEAVNNLFLGVEKGQKAGVFNLNESYIMHLSKMILIDYLKPLEESPKPKPKPKLESKPTK